MMHTIERANEKNSEQANEKRQGARERERELQGDEETKRKIDI